MIIMITIIIIIITEALAVVAFNLRFVIITGVIRTIF